MVDDAPRLVSFISDSADDVVISTLLSPDELMDDGDVETVSSRARPSTIL